MLDVYENMKERVRESYMVIKRYDKCIKLANDYIEMLKNDKENTKEDLFPHLVIAYYYSALGYKKMDDYKMALKQGKTALRYTTPFKYDYTYVIIKWLIAETQSYLGEEDHAIKTFKECKKIFNDLEMPRYSATMTYNIYKIEKNELKMFDLIKEYEYFLLNEDKEKYSITYLNEIQKDNVLQEMYVELVNIYIIKQKQDEIFKLLKDVKNKDLRKLLENKLIA